MSRRNRIGLIIGAIGVAVALIAGAIALAFWPDRSIELSQPQFKQYTEAPQETTVVAEGLRSPSVVAYGDDHVVVASTFDEVVQLWNLETGEMEWETALEDPGRGKPAIRTVPDQDKVIVNLVDQAEDTVAHVMDATTGEISTTMELGPLGFLTTTTGGKPLASVPDVQTLVIEVTLLSEFDLNSEVWSATYSGQALVDENLDAYVSHEHHDMLLVHGLSTDLSWFQAAVDLETGEEIDPLNGDDASLMVVGDDVLRIPSNTMFGEIALYDAEGNQKWGLETTVGQRSPVVHDGQLYFSGLSEDHQSWEIRSVSVDEGEVTWATSPENARGNSFLTYDEGVLTGWFTGQEGMVVAQLDPGSGDVQTEHAVDLTEAWLAVATHDMSVLVSNDTTQGVELHGFSVADGEMKWTQAYEGAHQLRVLGNRLVLDKTMAEQGLVVLD